MQDLCHIISFIGSARLLFSLLTIHIGRPVYWSQQQCYSTSNLQLKCIWRWWWKRSFISNSCFQPDIYHPQYFHTDNIYLFHLHFCQAKANKFYFKHVIQSSEHLSSTVPVSALVQCFVLFLLCVARLYWECHVKSHLALPNGTYISLLYSIIPFNIYFFFPFFFLNNCTLFQLVIL